VNTIDEVDATGQGRLKGRAASMGLSSGFSARDNNSPEGEAASRGMAEATKPGSALAAGIRADAAEVEQGRGESPRYTCRDCGGISSRRMVDGRCPTCNGRALDAAVPPVRCERCYRVRYSHDGDWENHPGKLPGEVAGRCGSIVKANAEARLLREARRTERRAATPGGLDHMHTADPFEGMREED
jgi:hypothetical protein